jgi:hypothetical protein
MISMSSWACSTGMAFERTLTEDNALVSEDIRDDILLVGYQEGI